MDGNCSSPWVKIMRACRQGRFWSTIRQRLHPMIAGARYAFVNLAAGKIQLHWPAYVEPDPEEREIVVRIFKAFQRMKKDEAGAPAWYAPAPMWRQLLDHAYAQPISAAANGDVAAFHQFLANFGAWGTYLGIDAPVLREARRSWLGRRYLENDIFGKQLACWQWFYNGRKQLAALTQPRIGNQAGALINGVFVTAGAFFNEVYGSLLSELVRDVERPVIAELGAGYGKLAHFLVRHLNACTYVDFDLPEILCVAAYYLMRSFPEKHVLLYGEEPYSDATHGRYDLIFMPAYEMPKVGSSSVELFLNKNSLGEMSREAIEQYVAIIARSTRYFFHLNHDVYPNIYDNGERSLLGYEYPVPPGQFKLVFRYPDLGHLYGSGRLDFRSDIFAYLYERMSGHCAVNQQPSAMATVWGGKYVS